ncbi:MULTISPECIES: hypothetical protein [Sphingobacterium]|uniref:Uncharacterized protein n=1 Tax=Sphingobacterium tenebrionis TaxID=3111775 RepID=A0ABU8IAC3_9SPHI|nr:hypothetical protein [Sphingobacterium sp. 1.A.4]
MNKFLLLILVLIAVTGISFGIHYAVLQYNDLDHWWIGSGYSLLGMYAFCAIASLVMAMVYVGVDYSMPTQTGFAFLIGMTIKAAASYFYIQEGINLLENDFIELNFMVVFFIYLGYDAFVAYYLVNQHEPEPKK